MVERVSKQGALSGINEVGTPLVLAWSGNLRRTLPNLLFGKKNLVWYRPPPVQVTSWRILPEMPLFWYKTGNWDFCSIGLVEVLWKKMTWILNSHHQAEIQLHGTLYCFYTSRVIEYIIRDLLTHLYHLLYQLGFKGGYSITLLV